MLRSSLFTASAFALVASAAAQSSSPAFRNATPITGPVKNAGTYHLATGTWTRAANSVVANFGASDNVYSNTADYGYYEPGIGPGPAAAAPLGQLLDAAAIPGTTNPATFALGGPDREDNLITELNLGYCDFDLNAGVAGWTLDFYDDYAPCTFPPPAPKGTVVLTGFPSNGCWIVDIDLTGGFEFTLQADGGATAPGFDNDPALDSIGISYRYTGTGTGNAGPILCGDPAATDTGWLAGGPPTTGSNTYYGEVGGCPGSGSGYQNTDNFHIEDTFASGFPSGCYFFGGYSNSNPDCVSALTAADTPYSGFWMEMSSTGGDAPPISQAGCIGAVTSTGAPAICQVFGDIVAANDDAVLTASGLPANQFGIFATGLATVPPNTILSGDGWICINPGIMGGLGRFQGSAQIKNSGATGEITLDTNTSEWSLTAVPTSVGSYATMTGVTANFQAWFRDTPAGNTGFNFSGSCEVTWQ